MAHAVQPACLSHEGPAHPWSQIPASEHLVPFQKTAGPWSPREEHQVTEWGPGPRVGSKNSLDAALSLLLFSTRWKFLGDEEKPEKKEGPRLLSQTLGTEASLDMCSLNPELETSSQLVCIPQGVCPFSLCLALLKSHTLTAKEPESK